jgi:putative transcriptional regulator
MQRLRLKADGRIVELRDGREFPLAPARLRPPLRPGPTSRCGERRVRLRPRSSPARAPDPARIRRPARGAGREPSATGSRANACRADRRGRFSPSSPMRRRRCLPPRAECKRPPWGQGGRSGRRQRVDQPVSDVGGLVPSCGLGCLNLFLDWACRQLQNRSPLPGSEVGKTERLHRSRIPARRDVGAGSSRFIWRNRASRSPMFLRNIMPSV